MAQQTIRAHLRINLLEGIRKERTIRVFCIKIHKNSILLILIYLNLRDKVKNSTMN